MVKRLIAVASVAIVILATFLTFSTTSNAATTSKHFITNLHGDYSPSALGYNVFDTGSSDSQINGLPAGVQALVWLGQKCPTTVDTTFMATVDRLSTNAKVFGYYLSDEPHIADCPGGPAALKTRADYVASKNPEQKTFIVLSKAVDFAPFSPVNTDVTNVGMDPYPCSISSPTCPISKITTRVNDALAAGIPLSTLVPVYQAFGQENLDPSLHYYNLPTPDQMTTMLAEWQRLIPSPAFDYTYGWGHQTSSNPTLVDSPGLQTVFQNYFTEGGAAPTVSPTVSPTPTVSPSPTPTKTHKPHPTKPTHS